MKGSSGQGQAKGKTKSKVEIRAKGEAKKARNGPIKPKNLVKDESSTRRTEDTKGRILRAAIEVYSKKGIGAATLKEIAQKAEIDQPLLNYYYPTIQEMHSDIIRYVLESLRVSIFEPLAASTDFWETFREYIMGYFRWAERNPSLYSIWLYFYYIASVEPYYRDQCTLTREVGRERLLSLIYRGIATNQIQKTPYGSVEEMAQQIYALINGNFVLLFTENNQDPKKLAQTTFHFAKAWLMGQMEALSPSSR